VASLSGAYRTIYDACCGRHPDQNIFHDEWLCLRDIHADLRTYAHHVTGRTLDVGCGSKPYASWFTGVGEYVGLDVGDNPAADFLVAEDQEWPFPDSAFESVVSFQALEHVRDIGLAQREISRVVRPRGIICLAVPFIAYEHAAPSDYRRYSKDGIRLLFPDFEIIEVVTQGAFGSATGTLLLRFVRAAMQRTRVTRALWMPLLPAWMLFTALVNAWGWLFDKLDGTGRFYHNVLLLARKPG